MGDFTFNRGNLNTIMLTVLRFSNAIPTFPTDYTTPQLRISHINGGAEVEDLIFTNMNQILSSNRWFYKYSIPALAAYTKYLVTFKTTLEGIITLTAEEFRVVPVSDISGAGEFTIVLTVKNSITHSPIPGARITVRDSGNPDTVLAEVFTDSNGDGTLFLNAGSYLAEFEKTGDISEVHTLTVFIDGTYELSGD